jgi:hypothetical protein
LICRSKTQNREKLQTVSRQDTTAEFQTCKQTEQELSNIETAHLNLKRIDKIGVENAKTLCARDYKGFGTGFDTMNGVTECEIKEK